MVLAYHIQWCSQTQQPMHPSGANGTLEVACAQALSIMPIVGRQRRTVLYRINRCAHHPGAVYLTRAMHSPYVSEPPLCRYERILPLLVRSLKICLCGKVCMLNRTRYFLYVYPGTSCNAHAAASPWIHVIERFAGAANLDQIPQVSENRVTNGAQASPGWPATSWTSSFGTPHDGFLAFSRAADPCTLTAMRSSPAS